MQDRSDQTAPFRSTRYLLAVLGLTLATLPGQAADYVWDGEFGGLWNHIFTTPGGTFQTNWEPDDNASLMIPGFGDRVFFQDTVANTTVNLNGNRTVDEVVFGGSTGYALDNNTLTLADGLLTATGSATHTVNSAVALGGTGVWSVGDTARVIVNGVVGHLGNSFTLVKTGSGTLQLTANNTHAGTTVMGGVLLVDDGDQLGADMTTLTLDGGELRAAGAFTGGAFRGLAVGPGGGVFNTNGFDAGWDWVISGTGTLEKTGAGTLTLTTGSSSNHTGLIRVTGGTLDFGGPGSSRTIRGDLTLDGGDANALSDLQFHVTSDVVVNNGTLGLGATDQWLDTLTVGTGGVVTMTDGEFRADGDVLIDGGQFLRSSFAVSTGLGFRLTLGHALTVQNGGLFEWGGGHGALALQEVGTSFLVTGPGSIFRQTDTSGADHTLTIQSNVPFAVEQGGELEAEYLHLTQGVLTVDGAGSLLDVTHGGTPLIEHRIGNSRLALSNGATGSFESALPTALVVGNIFTVGQNAKVEVFSGSTLTIQSLKMDTTGQADFFVRGAGSTVDQVGASTSTIGRTSGFGQRLHLQDQGVFNTGTGLTTVNATGTINIESGATLNLNGSLEVNGGVVNISDAGSSLTQTGGGTITFDGAGFATANLTLAGGEVNTGTGQITIRNGASVSIPIAVGFNANGDVLIDDATLISRSTGLLSNEFGLLLAAGRTLTATNDAQVSYTGSYNLDSGTTYLIQDGADFSTAAFLDVGRGTDGTLIVDGPGSTLTTNTDFQVNWLDWGMQGATGTVTLRNQAHAVVNAPSIILARQGDSKTRGILNIQSGATMSAPSILVAGVETNSFGTGILTIDGNGSVLTQSGNASLTIGNSATSNGEVSLTNNGTLTTGTGLTTVNATGTINIDGGHLNATHIDHTHGGAFNFTAGTLAVQTFEGDLTNHGGTLRAGKHVGNVDMLDAYGTTTVNGDYTQQADAALAFMIGNNDSPGVTFDRLAVNGHLEFAGDLQVVLGNTVVLVLGDRFDLIDWDTAGGTFDSIQLPGPASVFGWNTEDLYITGEISYESRGDLNTDGFVGIEDLDIVLANWNRSVQAYDYSAGDATGDGFVDDADLQTVLSRWGLGPLPGGDVPEPGSAVLLGLGLLGVALRRRV